MQGMKNKDPGKDTTIDYVNLTIIYILINYDSIFSLTESPHNIYLVLWENMYIVADGAICTLDKRCT